MIEAKIILVLLEYEHRSYLESYSIAIYKSSNYPFLGTINPQQKRKSCLFKVTKERILINEIEKSQIFMRIMDLKRNAEPIISNKEHLLGRRLTAMEQESIIDEIATRRNQAA